MRFIFYKYDDKYDNENENEYYDYLPDVWLMHIWTYATYDESCLPTYCLCHSQWCENQTPQGHLIDNVIIPWNFHEIFAEL